MESVIIFRVVKEQWSDDGASFSVNLVHLRVNVSGVDESLGESASCSELSGGILEIEEF